ncbi:MAG TPA: hydroxyectoine utilization dehydratase EutB [Bacillales bacterium]|nr:hydroxyectoine utilization dehydratase EutB [Bacillales bacterium]
MVPIQQVWEARRRIGTLVRKTSFRECPFLSEPSKGRVSLKMETEQPTGAFKIRGAANKILSLSDEEQARGVVAYSTGNHGLAVAYVASQLGIDAHICVSNRVPRAKAEAIRKFGGKLEIYGDSQDDAGRRARELRDHEGLTVIEPFDDPHVIAGQGTIGLELLEEAPDIDTVFVPLSGGGLISGIALSVKANNPNVRIVGLSMERGAVMHESLKAGRPVEIAEVETLADSLLGGIGRDNRYTFAMVKQYVDETYLVSEAAIADGMKFLMKRHRIVAEGAAAIGVGALLHQTVPATGKHAAVIVSGKNVDPAAYFKVVNDVS